MTQLKKHALQLAVLIGITVLGTNTQAQTQDWKTEKKVNILFGLAQPMLAKGFNIEGNYIHNRFIFDYSHGASLDFSGNLLPNDMKAQKLAIHEPWTTGLGIGYRLKEWINIRVEPKWHKFEFYYDGEAQTRSSMITSYKTFSLGVGVYGSYQPFKKKNSFLKNILVAPSVRFWPTVSSSLKDEPFTYLNKKTGAEEKIKRLDAGSGFSPLVVNVSVGYSFQFKKRK